MRTSKRDLILDTAVGLIGDAGLAAAAVAHGKSAYASYLCELLERGKDR